MIARKRAIHPVNQIKIDCEREVKLIENRQTHFCEKHSLHTDRCGACNNLCCYCTGSAFLAIFPFAVKYQPG